MMSYKDAVLSPSIPWDKVRNNFVKMPAQLYKFQSFYDSSNHENPYWRSNMGGAFHMSLGRDFSDQNDCNPNTNEISVEKEIRNDFKNLNVPENKIDEILAHLNKKELSDQIAETVENYRSQIRIGCFTKTYQNREMWKIYSDNNKGYCIEYNTNECQLFYENTYPVIYSDESYDFTRTYVMCAFYNSVCKDEDKYFDNIKDTMQNFIRKLTYVPVLIKERKPYDFEKEYRMFLTQSEASVNLNKNFNLNLFKAVSAIYLGTEFYKNDNAEAIKKEVLEIAKEQKLNVYQMKDNENQEGDLEVDVVYDSGFPQIRY